MGKRREKNKLVKENYIQAAQSVFVRHGYRGATTSEIAVEAGLSEGNLYRHFDSKHDLLIKIMHHIYELYKNHLDDALQPVTGPLEIIEAVFKSHADFIRKHPLEAQVITRVCPFLMEDKDVPCKAIFVEQNGLIHSKLKEAIEEGVQEGKFAVADPGETVTAVSFLLHGYLRVQLLSKDPKVGALKAKRLVVDFCKKALEK